jgi:hypothetical protein
MMFGSKKRRKLLFMNIKAVTKSIKYILKPLKNVTIRRILDIIHKKHFKHNFVHINVSLPNIHVTGITYHSNWYIYVTMKAVLFLLTEYNH